MSTNHVTLLVATVVSSASVVSIIAVGVGEVR